MPKTSAGQGLRAVLNTYDRVPRVVATRGEFDSLDVILREYARRGRIALTFVESRPDGHFDSARHRARDRTSAQTWSSCQQVLFSTGQRLADLPAIIGARNAAGARVLLDVYHALGVFPVDVTALDVDFAVGGSYKYLRGGPGACFLYLAPRHLDGSLATLDTGWFAKREPFAYLRPDPPQYAEGGDAFLESTPPVLPFYQARAGQVFTLAIGVERLRAHSLALQQRLVGAARGARRARVRRHDGPRRVRRRRGRSRGSNGRRSCANAGVVTDARGRYLRLCPDILTTDEELAAAAEALGGVARQR